MMPMMGPHMGMPHMTKIVNGTGINYDVAYELAMQSFYYLVFAAFIPFVSSAGGAVVREFLLWVKTWGVFSYASEKISPVWNTVTLFSEPGSAASPEIYAVLEATYTVEYQQNQRGLSDTMIAITQSGDKNSGSASASSRDNKKSKVTYAFIPAKEYCFEDNMYITYTETKPDGDKIKVASSSLTIRSQVKTTSEIHQFVEKCASKFNDKISEAEQMYYTLNSGSSSSSSISLTGTPLKVRKTNIINNIPFTGKADLIKALDEHKTDPTKSTTILAHGIPGTGKTTLIKAIARYTGRSVFVLKLSELNINQLNIMLYDTSFQALTESGAHASRGTVEPHKRLIVFEEVDADQDAVGPRKGANRVGLNNGGSIRDAVDVRQMLLALDGIRELYGVIIIFTTNHPEKIDPALMRPGRMNFIIKMRPLKVDDCIEIAKGQYAAAEFDPDIIRRYVKDDIYTLADIHDVFKHSSNTEELINSFIEFEDRIKQREEIKKLQEEELQRQKDEAEKERTMVMMRATAIGSLAG